MKVAFARKGRAGYSLIECLVYISLVVVVLGCASLAMYRGLDQLIVLKRNADDISAALKVGELWRADVRAGLGGIGNVQTEAGPAVRIETTAGDVMYHTADNVLWRTKGGARAPVLRNVKNSAMTPELRGGVTAWRWELELQPRAKGGVKPGRVRPLFTFLAVQPRNSKPL